MTMRLGFLRDVRKTTRHMAFGNLLYDWTLNGTVPEKFIVNLKDSWPGDPVRGRFLCEGAFMIDGERLELRGRCWEPEGVSAAWLHHMHGFSWLRDLRACGGDLPRRQARSLIMDWIGCYKGWKALAWQSDIAGERIGNWIALYEFFGASADDEFQRVFLASLTRQARHLSRALPGDVAGLPLLQAVRGLAFAGLAFEGREAWLEQALNLLEQETEKQILPDGGHVSRSPAQTLEALKIFVDLRNGLLAAKYPVPEKMAHTIDRIAQAVRFFRYTDKGLAVFNGAQEGAADMIDAALIPAGGQGRILRSLPHMGYERLTAGRTVVMVDAGAPPPWPYDSQAHAAPLAFEMTYGRERVLVSCGDHALDGGWRDALRATPAHNAVVIDSRNACELRDDGHFGRRAKKIIYARHDKDGAVLFDGTHDGYVPVNGITHRRLLYLSPNGHDLRGEEMLACAVGLSKPVEICARFHLHPDVQASVIQDGREILLRLPGGAGWRFLRNGGVLSLEDSLYMGNGLRPRKTKQIVVSCVMENDSAVLKWALQREQKS